MYSILIIEDDPLLNRNMELILQMEGFDVRTAHDGLSGLAQTRDQRPDIILCDIKMPGMDGNTLLETIKGDPDFVDIVFIFITALSDQAHMRSGMLAGADYYLAKPFSIEDLLAVITGRLRKLEILRERSMDAEAAEKQRRLQHISRREREILLLIGQGNTSKSIAGKLFISPKTVDVHRGQLMKKLGASNAVMLAPWAAIAEKMT
jgi:DNA-binding NarL/FixJ family response regulator